LDYGGGQDIAKRHTRSAFDVDQYCPNLGYWGELVMVRDYIMKIGFATESEAKLALSILLHDRYTKERSAEVHTDSENESIAVLLAAAVMNMVFGEIPIPSGGRRMDEVVKESSFPEATLRFAKENAPYVESQARSLSSEDNLCAILSGAAYNTCYARYIRAGGRRGPFSNTFLTFVRSIYKLEYMDANLKAYSQILNLGFEILRPIESMVGLGIFRRLSRNPDERGFYDATHKFAIAVGVKFKG